MKRSIRINVIGILALFIIYAILLKSLCGSHIIAGVLSPGSHLPFYFPALILLFILCRFIMVLLPGILLYRLGSIWFKHRKPKR
ncbi:MAG: hypothetical protein JXR23_01445 [Pontiellaceae bacterium]|nr:hypothetical protein [Pontiellaceae bacterium]